MKASKRSWAITVALALALVPAVALAQFGTGSGAPPVIDSGFDMFKAIFSIRNLIIIATIATIVCGVMAMFDSLTVRRGVMVLAGSVIAFAAGPFATWAAGRFGGGAI